jgi:hypothetical protein
VRRASGQSTAADEGCGYADEGEEVFGLAFIAAVETAAAGQPGRRSLDHPPMPAQPLRGLDILTGDTVADTALAEPSAQVVVVVALVRVQFRRPPTPRPAAGPDGRDTARKGLQALTIMHVRAGDTQ